MTTSRAFQWPEGIRGAVSLSFDDGRPSQLEQAIPILDRLGVKGTFYLTPGRITDAAQAWRQVKSSGHEIGNHSLRHSCSGNFIWGARNVLENYTLTEMEEELAEASRCLTELIGATPTTFAYPCGQTFVGRGITRRSYVPAVARQFLAGRGFRDEHLNRPDFCDLAKLAGTELDGLRASDMIALARKALESGLWIVFAGHDVGSRERQCIQPHDLEAFCTWCRNPENGIWIGSVAEIAAHVHTQRRPREDPQGRLEEDRPPADHVGPETKH